MADLILGSHPAQRLDLRRFRPAGDGVADDTIPITNWINESWQRGIPGFAPPGTYLIDPITINLEAPLVLEFMRGAVIKGAADGAASLLTIDGGVDRHTARITGATIDNSLMSFVSAEASGTCLTLKRLDDYLIDWCRFLSTNSYADAKGDSGISMNTCARGVVRNCYFRGQPDLGVYITGGASALNTDDFGDQIVEACFFENCAGAGAAKRQSQRVIFTNCIVIGCRTGFSHSEASSVPPGFNLIVANSYFKNVGSRAVTAKPGATVQFNNNTIEDWGYASETSFDFAVSIEGATNGMFTNNIFRFRDLLGTDKRAFRVRHATIDAVTYNSSGNMIDGNIIVGPTRGIVEEDGTANNFGANRFIGVTTPYTLAPNGLSNSYYTAL